MYGRSTDALRSWIYRWNQQNPDRPIRRHPGYVDLGDLQAAMDEWDRRYTPALRVQEALSKAQSRKR